MMGAIQQEIEYHLSQKTQYIFSVSHFMLKAAQAHQDPDQVSYSSLIFLSLRHPHLLQSTVYALVEHLGSCRQKMAQGV